MQVELKVDDINLSVTCDITKADDAFSSSGLDWDVEILEVFLADETVDIWPMFDDEEFANKIEDEIYLKIMRNDI